MNSQSNDEEKSLLAEAELDKVRLAGTIEGINVFIHGYCKILSERCDLVIEKFKNEAIGEKQREIDVLTITMLAKIHNELAEMGNNIESINVVQRVQQLLHS